MTTVPIDQIAQMAYQAGFRGQGLQWITQIAMRESGGKADAYNPNVHTGDQSWGLMQINTLGGNAANIRNILQGLGRSGDFHDLWDPAVNMQVAFKLSSNGSNFEPWRSHSPGSDGPEGWLTNTQQYAPAASAAVAKAGFGPAATNTLYRQNITQAQQGQGGVQTRLVSWLNQQIGKDYRFATKGPNTFDCSGLTAAMYDQIGIHLPAFTLTQAEAGMRVDTNNLQPGDLVFFHGAPMPGHPDGNLGHVGVYIGGGQYINAPHTGAKVQVAQLDPSRVQMARRIVDAQGRFITGGATQAQLDPNVQTVAPTDVSMNYGLSDTAIDGGFGTTPQLLSGMNNPLDKGFGVALPDATKDSQFALPTHDFTTVLPGEGSKIEALV